MKKHDARLSRFLAAFVCGTGLGAGLCFCLKSSFSLQAGAGWLALFCAAAGAVFAGLLLLPRFWPYLVCALLAGGGLALFWDEIAPSAISTAAAVYAFYCGVFPKLPEAAAVPEVLATAALACVGAWFAFLSALVVCRRKSALWAIAPAAPVLVLCLVILETPPAPWSAVLVVFCIALLVFTQRSRLTPHGQGSRLALLLLLPLACYAALPALLVPAAEYQRAAWPQALKTHAQEAIKTLSVLPKRVSSVSFPTSSAFSPSLLGSYLWDSGVSGFNLSRIGPQTQFSLHVMQVRTGAPSGSVYLRGASMARYDGHRWSPADAADEAEISRLEAPLAAPSQAPVYALEIQTDMKSGVRYLPCWPAASEAVTLSGDSYVSNPEQETEYSYFFSPQTSADIAAPGYAAFAAQTYTQLPEGLAESVSDVMQALQASASAAPTTEEKIRLVQAYVQQSARYDLNTQRAPADRDFTEWFLHESETGYCVHFATAATVLLRLWDVPARFVTGYLAESTQDGWTDVTSDDAHAWTEAYVDGLGWVQLDATPAASARQPGPDASGGGEPAPEGASPDLPQGGTQPSGTPEESKPQGGAAAAEKKRFRLPGIVWALLGLAALVFSWRALLFSIRAAAMGRGSCNRRAVMYYRHAQWLAKISGRTTPDELTALAEKARFSRHKLTQEELQQLRDFCSELTVGLRQDRRPWKRALYRVVYALW